MHPAGTGRFLKRADFRTGKIGRHRVISRGVPVERCLACEADVERSDITRNGLVAHLRSTSFEELDPDYGKAML